MAIRGTTPDYILTVNADLTGKTVYVTIAQYPGCKLTLTGDDLLIYPGEETVINITLTQEQTLGFADGDAEVQVKFISEDGKTHATDIQQITIDRALLDRVVKYSG